MKAPVVAAAAVALGLVLGTGVGAVHTRDVLAEEAEHAAKEAEHAVADSIAAATLASAEGAVEASSGPEGEGHEIVPGEEAHGTPEGAAMADEHGAPVAPAPAEADPKGAAANAKGAAPVVPAKAADDRSGAASPEAAKRLGKIFSAMNPSDAAAVLAQLEDRDVQAILGTLSERQAAALLAVFPRDRAAVLSKAALAAHDVAAK